MIFTCYLYIDVNKNALTVVVQISHVLESLSLVVAQLKLVLFGVAELRYEN